MLPNPYPLSPCPVVPLSSSPPFPLLPVPYSIVMSLYMPAYEQVRRRFLNLGYFK